MSAKSTERDSAITDLPFYNVRHISCPEDAENGRKVYVGHVPISAIVDLSTDENVRDYLLEAEGRKRRKPTQVHRAIENTLKNYPGLFSVLNSGVVIVARSLEIDEKDKCLRLLSPSIINGSQTQGVIKDFLAARFDDGTIEDQPEPHVKFEVVVTEDDDLIADISIARNLQNDVLSISIAGRLGQLDELESSLQSRMPGAKLQKSETKLSDDYIKTERLLQVITALIPMELWQKGRDFNKVFTYSQKAKCLKEFQEVFKRAKDATDSEHDFYEKLYQFYLDIAPEALELYTKWKSHQGFAGTGIHAIRRKGRQIEEVPDGIVFPILSSLSVFAKKVRSGWSIVPPKAFSDEELIGVAKRNYGEIANHNPWNMGKSRACYSALYQLTSIFSKYTK